MGAKFIPPATEIIYFDGVPLIGPAGVNAAYQNKLLWNAVTNGCGAGGAKIDVIPDHAYGLSIRPVCDLHDFAWHTCKPTREEFEFWNKVFRKNFQTWVKAKTPNTLRYMPLRYARLARSYTFYWGVSSWKGWAYFTNGLQTPEHTTRGL